ncbi:MAG: hydantoinase B/oxoprolinase family protein [Alphaproteobacteria bacterium]
MPGHGALSNIHMQIMWNRLIAVVEEQAQTLVRTAFSTSVREAGDLSAGVFDRRGRMLAQAVTGTPGHVNCMAEAVVHFIARFPVDEMAPGDVFVTNDPWIASGHLHDLTFVTPIFRKGRVVAMFSNTTHVVDIGGRGFGPDALEVFEEGLNIPIMPLFRRGEPNETLLDIVRTNVREPQQVVGDIFACAACNDIGGRRLIDMMDEFALDDLAELADFIIEHSRRATIAKIARLEPGTYSNDMATDGYDRDVRLKATMTVSADSIHVDYSGVSPASPFGINVVLNYTKAYTCFGVKCIIAPEVPNNAGSLAPITTSAPAGSILNVERPRAVAVRHVIGHLLPDTVFGCLQQVVPGGVPAEGAASLWNVQLRGVPPADDAGAGVDTPPFEMLQFNSGGAGARPAKDGLSATAFPSGVRGMPVEANEAITPVVFWRKELRPDSGGAGAARGGLGQVIEIGGAGGIPFDVLAMFERCRNPARGRAGGKGGAAGRVGLASGLELRGKGRQSVPAGDRLCLELPGGGGYGDPFARAPERVAADVRNGLVSPMSARADYGVVLTEDGAIDETATAAARERD